MGAVIAIIPARGGSVGVPRKNLRRVGGVPLIGRAIAAARAARGIDLVVVSTDDEEIAAVAREWGARVIARPAHLSGGEASSESALQHALDELESEGTTARTLVFLQATSPFVPAEALDEAIALVEEGGFDCVFAARESFEFVWRREASGAVAALGHDATRRPRRQDRMPDLVETGGFYVMDAEGFRAAGHRFFGRTGVVVVPEESAIEIDTPEQLAAARALAHAYDAARPIDVDAVVTDFDGVHTDDAAYVDSSGRELVRVSRRDGLGVSLLRRAGIRMLILSAETDGVVAARARKLGCDVAQGVERKADVLREWIDVHGLDPRRIAYLGNDVNDLDCLELVGWPVAVADAHPLARAAARTVLSTPGGGGAVRELAERVLAGRAQDMADALARKERTT